MKTIPEGKVLPGSPPRTTRPLVLVLLGWHRAPLSAAGLAVPAERASVCGPSRRPGEGRSRPTASRTSHPIPTKAKALVLPSSPNAIAAERTGGAATNGESQPMARRAPQAEAASPNTQKSWKLEGGSPVFPRGSSHSEVLSNTRSLLFPPKKYRLQRFALLF